MRSYRFVFISLFVAGTMNHTIVSPALTQTRNETQTSPTIAKAAGETAGTDWIDITAPLDPHRTPIYPGDAPLKFTYVKQIDKGDMLNLSAFCFGAHSGTHVDAPAHFIAGSATTEQIPLSAFLGPVRVIECDPGAGAIDSAELRKHDWRGAKRVFFKTRNSLNHWMTDPAFHADFTYLAPDAARDLADAGVELVGVDYISAEKFRAEPTTHRILLGKGIPIVEGLMLDCVADGRYELTMLPMNIAGHEGAPVRAVLRKMATVR